MTKHDYEILKILETADKELRIKLKSLIKNTYIETIKEIKSSNFIEVKKVKYPRINYFLISLFFDVFEKMHKGDKEISIQIINDLKSKLKNL